MASYDANNPIRSIDGAYVPVPSRYQWSLQDVSAPNAGRTEDGLMHKQRLSGSAGQKRKIELEWSYPSDSEIAEILTAFNPEYITVVYKDAMANAYLTKVFYVGDRTSPLYNAKQKRWENVAFNIIER